MGSRHLSLARHLHALFGALEMQHFVKTSGQDGLHVLLPLAAAYTHDEARELAEAVARTLCAELPEIATVTRPVAGRAGGAGLDAARLA